MILWFLLLQLDPKVKTELFARLTKLERFQAQFEQETYSDFFDAVHAKGLIQIERPGHLRMEYREGENKTVICDGSTFYEFDADAETETRLAQGDFENEPLIRIFLYGQNIEEVFMIDRVQDSEKGELFRFRPRGQDDYSFTLRFNEQGLPQEVTVENPDGEGTHFAFSQWDLKPSFKPDTFKIPAPKP